MTDLHPRHAETARDVVRRQTDAAHAKLHLHATFVALFEGNIELDAYTRLIQRFHGFYAPLDRAIEQTIATMPDGRDRYPYVRRSDLLAQDLIDLKATALDLRGGPQCTRAAQIVTPETLGGVLYVIEGATLGATGVDRAAQRLLDADNCAGRRFWAWGRAQKAQRWTLANDYLELRYAQGTALDDLVAGARDTFDVLADWLAPLEQPRPTLQRAAT
ncbi:biliverdin-producing heme oxygenase [Pseudosulfitobacter koreensis]|uniref:Biliverdin-producing heme oxygenase n=1 Tax=Pseudosulfitobacter koreensis TaxID=2968472 RepID=A0ABT1YWE2_9RHOB|nr:biliverdin-producing heme oxygenase [Pseudosulfitobacter koreense]